MEELIEKEELTLEEALRLREIARRLIRDYGNLGSVGQDEGGGGEVSAVNERTSPQPAF